VKSTVSLFFSPSTKTLIIAARRGGQAGSRSASAVAGDAAAIALRTRSHRQQSGGRGRWGWRPARMIAVGASRARLRVPSSRKISKGTSSEPKKTTP
jgi:hypothetical protein